MLVTLVVALAAPWAAAARDHAGCVATAACVAADTDDAVPCVTDARCGGVSAASMGVALLMAVVAALAPVPALLARRHDAAPPVRSSPLLLVSRLLRPPQPALPS